MSNAPTSESKVVLKPSETGPLEPLILRNTEQSLIARHPANCSWDHLVHVVESCRDEILKDFKQELDSMPSKYSVAQEPFSLTISFWRKGRPMTNKREKMAPDHLVAHVDAAEALLKKLPKMLWSLRKTHTNGRADTMMVAFEWLVTVDHAKVKDVAAMIAKVHAERGA